MCKKDYIWNYSTCTRENGRHAGSIIDDSAITHDEFTEETKTVPTKTFSAKSTQQILTKKGKPVKQKNYIFCLPFC